MGCSCSDSYSDKDWASKRIDFGFVLARGAVSNTTCRRVEHDVSRVRFRFDASIYSCSREESALHFPRRCILNLFCANFLCEISTTSPLQGSRSFLLDNLLDHGTVIAERARRRCRSAAGWVRLGLPVKCELLDHDYSASTGISHTAATVLGRLCC